MNKDKTFAEALSEVKAVFPFDHYITDSSVRGLFAVVRELKNHLPEFHGRRLLDIGCGAMFKTAVFQKMGFRCFAVDDLSDPWHQRNDNKEKIREYARSVGITFHQQTTGDYTIPFEAESFDVVTSLAVIEHLHESPRGLLNTMGTFARRGGMLILTTPNAVNLRKRLFVFLGRSNHVPMEQFYHSDGTWRGHVRELTLSELKYVCKQNGFDVVSSLTYESIAQDRLPFPLRTLYLTLGKIVPTLRSGLIVMAKKPDQWKPAKYRPEEFRKTIAKSVPDGVA